MRLIVGLGNPGPKYAGHRHNIGYMAVDRIASDHGFGPWKSKFQGMVSEGRFGSDRVVLLKPETFMNNSGQSVQAAMKFYKIDPADVIVFHDELDLAPGKVRVKMGGGRLEVFNFCSEQPHLFVIECAADVGTFGKSVDQDCIIDRPLIKAVEKRRNASPFGLQTILFSYNGVQLGVCISRVEFDENLSLSYSRSVLDVDRSNLPVKFRLYDLNTTYRYNLALPSRDHFNFEHTCHHNDCREDGHGKPDRGMKSG